MMHTRFFVFICTVTLLQGCAVMSKSDCLDADWESVGYDVGMDGEPDSKAAFIKRDELCSKHGVEADISAFEVGYEEGIIAYCQVENAVKLGIKAKSSALEFCSEYENPGFAAAYNSGYRLYELRRDEVATQNELQRLENQEYRTRRQIGDLRRTANSENSTEEQRREAARRIRYISRNAYDLSRSIDYLRDRYYQAKEAAETYEELLELEYEL